MNLLAKANKGAVFKRKTAALLTKFSAEVPNESNESIGRAIEALVLDFGRLRLGTGLEATVATDNSIRKLAVSIDGVEPVQVHAEKMIKLAFSGKYAEAGEYAGRLGTLRKAEVKEAIRNMAATGGNKKHEENNAVMAKALAHYDMHKSEYKTKKMAARELESKFQPIAYATYYSVLKGR